MGNQFQSVTVIACLTTFLFIFNIVFWLTDLLILIMGLWGEFDLYKYLEISTVFSGTAPYVMIGIVSLIVLTTAISFSYFTKRLPVALYIYGGFLACVFMMNAGIVASVASYRDTYAKGLHDGLTQAINSSEAHKANFNFVQSTMQCCGVSNYTDWIRSSPQKVIPMSCCIDPTHCVTANYSDVYQKGCYEVIVEYIEANVNIFIGVAVGIALLPLIGSILSCILASYIKKSKYDVMT